MNIVFLALAGGLIALGSGCTNMDRSRSLADPNVRPEVTAVQVCSTCHGIDGNSVSPNFPRLAGQQPAYLIAQLEHFRNHQRSDPPGFVYMWGISKNLTDGQIKGLADYYAKQTALPNATADARIMSDGRDIYEKGIPAKDVPACVACHQPKAEGLATFPRLAYQHRDYLVKQLRVFKDTEGRPNTPMKQVTHLLTEPEIDKVASYLQGFSNNK